MQGLGFRVRNARPDSDKEVKLARESRPDRTVEIPDSEALP